MEHILTVKTDLRELSLPAQSGESLLEALRRAGVAVPASCGGRGTCGRCRVLLDGESVLACRTAVSRDAAVTLREQSGGQILGGGEAPSERGAPDPGTGTVARDAEPSELGLAVDIGTTTIVAELLDLRSGAQLGTAAAWKAQAPYGADVISRCQYCMEHPDGTETLRAVIRAQVRGLALQLGAEPESLRRCFVAGNTVMQHLYAGLSPAGIAVAPFRPAALFIGDEPKEEGLSYAPCAAGYVGGDILAGLLASGLSRKAEHSLFLDIGTNGEMALGGAEGFVGCAVASGPAFEGVGISCGMAGIDGAVSHVRWDGGAPEWDVIGGTEARGLCGSGLIDLLAVLIEKRVVSGSGLLYGPEEAPEGFEDRLGEDENGNGIFFLTPDRRVFLTAADVRKLQLAKAAVAAGIAVLLKEAGLRAEEVDRLYLAGGFGTYMDVRSAAVIGMIPACLAERTVLLGNSSLAGAREALLHPEAREALEKIRMNFRYLELSGNAGFNEEYPEQMFFYEEDEDEWN